LLFYDLLLNGFLVEVTCQIEIRQDFSLLFDEFLKLRVTHVLVKVQQPCFVSRLLFIHVQGAFKEGEEVLEIVTVFCIHQGAHDKLIF
jgi:hypothetical protein